MSHSATKVSIKKPESSCLRLSWWHAIGHHLDTDDTTPQISGSLLLAISCWCLNTGGRVLNPTAFNFGAITPEWDLLSRYYWTTSCGRCRTCLSSPVLRGSLERYNDHLHLIPRVAIGLTSSRTNNLPDNHWCFAPVSMPELIVNDPDNLLPPGCFEVNPTTSLLKGRLEPGLLVSKPAESRKRLLRRGHTTASFKTAGISPS